MKQPTYDELLKTVRTIAATLIEGDQFEAGGIEAEYEMTINEAYETAFIVVSLARDVLGTDGSDLPIAPAREIWRPA